jgi:hypothetical protein
MKQFHKTRNLFKYSLTFSALATCISVATAAPITLVNQGFETGDLTGWSTVGNVVAAGQTITLVMLIAFIAYKNMFTGRIASLI